MTGIQRIRGAVRTKDGSFLIQGLQGACLSGKP
jgi:hypothetical protein